MQPALDRREPVLRVVLEQLGVTPEGNDVLLQPVPDRYVTGMVWLVQVA